MSSKPQQIGRLAMRVEGDHWVAYYAMPDTMEGAEQLGSIRMAAVTGVRRNAQRKQAFMDMMRGLVSDIIEEACGTRPQWNEPERAAERERAGKA